MRCGLVLSGEEVSLQNKTPVDHSICHILFASLEGDKRPDKINQNPESLNIICPKQETIV